MLWIRHSIFQLLGCCALALFPGHSISASDSIGFSAIAKQLAPRVVLIDGFMDPHDKKPFGSASGLFIDGEGVVVSVLNKFTNAKDRRMCVRYRVKLLDGKALEGNMFSVDALLNLAILKIAEPGTYPAIDTKARSIVRPGDKVLALVGTPGNKELSYSVGEVIAKQRKSIYGAGFGDMLIDMRIELPANGYGGPLINADGVVIGITTENIHADPTRRTDPREAHALPIGVAMIFYRATESYPTSQQNWIGIDLRPLRPADKDRIYKLLGKRAGLLADFVWIDGPAGHTDIRPGDVIFQINGRSINDTHDLTAFLRSASPGKPAELAILRDGKGILRRVRITARPPWAGFVR